ncbi:TMEM165/GDT1 family protein [Candidatus Synechococcus calcipolaris G9]|uniref:GDT1 family protein n=1 Tax=Candidatus Synechococcus calcipolaris G9 TaxID=1497997 RepID=A0ABT6F2G4_9SYNE|nr:TMEM165/GDT1 family protein [Candidatus Synechococcus calcipolaris]MDG2992046.1 TMEM165/GDT1 family protein [Candidatus Synechococcus calcipolaris G9]
MLTGFVAGLTLISISELGDKSFFIAMILASRHGKRWVFLGALLALTFMTVLAVLAGQVFGLLPPLYTHYGAIALFTFFGLRLLYRGWMMKNTLLSDDSEEIVEAEAAVEKAEVQGQQWRDHPIFGIIFEAFGLTFVAEWGDRTQFATITMAATYNPWGVAAGAILGHALCLLIAVWGGHLMARQLSERTLTLLGGGLFLFFGVLTAGI